MDEREPRAGNYCYCIGLMKYRSDWRICHGVYADMHEGGPDDWKPIMECSVEERVNAAPHIGKLRKKLVESAEKYVAKVDKAVAEMTTALEQF